MTLRAAGKLNIIWWGHTRRDDDITRGCGQVDPTHHWVVSGEEMKEAVVDCLNLLHVLLQWQVLQQYWHHLRVCVCRCVCVGVCERENGV